MKQPVQKRSERGVVMLIGVLSFAIIIPMVGLSVDVGYLYASKARLQAAVDGASLAAARALNLGSGTSAQVTSAKQNAVNWFYSNFPPGNWSTTSTVMSNATVDVYDDTVNPNLRHVDVTASTRVPTFFMKWFNLSSTNINAKGFATRRDAVIMLVLDRSGSMCQPGGSPCGGPSQQARACGPMKDAAKLFTGQFAAGRDYIGMLSYSDGIYVHSSPTRNFRTSLGYYASASDNGAGSIDNIQCHGRTASASAISVAYNELYKHNLPGAFNVIVFETDGLPNTLTMNMWDGSAFGMRDQGSSTGCQDANNRRKGGSPAGWGTPYANGRQWISGFSMTGSNPGYMGNIPAGPIMGVFAADPTQTHTVELGYQPFQSNATTGLNYISTSNTPGCTFNSTRTNTNDVAWLPRADVFGNDVNPPTGAYLTGTNISAGHLVFGGSSTAAANWDNFHKAAYNATDHAAYRARANTYIKPSVFVIGLGGQGSDPPDYTLLQRVANDPRADSYNTPARYIACASTPGCVTYSSQNAGQFIFSTDQSQLRQVFLSMSSQILRLSQ